MRPETYDDVWLVGGVRSALGRFGGALREVPVVDLARQVIGAALDRLDWSPDALDEMYVGIGMIEAGMMVPARQIALAAGLPEHLPSLTVDRACCSGATTVGLAARSIERGAGSVLCVGVENMSRTPRLLHGTRWGTRLGSLDVEDLLLMHSPVVDEPIASYVGRVALEHGIGREEQDRWALTSQQRHAEATARGYFSNEITPVETPDGPFSKDEHPRPDTTLKALGRLPTVRNSPTVTAGNAPGLNDGAVALVVADRASAGDRVPLARVAAYLQTAESPISSAYLPGLAIRRLVEKQGLRPEDLDVIEINEAYAATPLVSIRRLADNDPALEEKLLQRTNMNGGAVAMGHPVGASGARLVLTAARQLRETGGRWAAVAICGGFGQTDALLLESADA
ncbi:MAG TPA: thiolase family protein [Acidimicrobiia bacterium]|nr:thiolase family protein [Acidimicrobiia bacterium]